MPCTFPTVPGGEPPKRTSEDICFMCGGPWDVCEGRHAYVEADTDALDEEEDAPE